MIGSVKACILATRCACRIPNNVLRAHTWHFSNKEVDQTFGLIHEDEKESKKRKRMLQQRLQKTQAKNKLLRELRRKVKNTYTFKDNGEVCVGTVVKIDRFSETGVEVKLANNKRIYYTPEVFNAIITKTDTHPKYPKGVEFIRWNSTTTSKKRKYEKINDDGNESLKRKTQKTEIDDGQILHMPI